MSGSTANVGYVGLIIVDDIAYDYISYLIQMSSLFVDEPTASSILTVHTIRTSMGVYTFISHRLTFRFVYFASLKHQLRHNTA
jgi:hypothetical protein